MSSAAALIGLGGWFVFALWQANANVHVSPVKRDEFMPPSLLDFNKRKPQRVLFPYNSSPVDTHSDSEFSTCVDRHDSTARRREATVGVRASGFGAGRKRLHRLRRRRGTAARRHTGPMHRARHGAISATLSECGCVCARSHRRASARRSSLGHIAGRCRCGRQRGRRAATPYGVGGVGCAQTCARRALRGLREFRHSPGGSRFGNRYRRDGHRLCSIEARRRSLPDVARPWIGQCCALYSSSATTPMGGRHSCVRWLPVHS